MLSKLLFFCVAACPILVAYAAVGGPTNIRMRVTTKKYCDHDRVDGNGNPAPCGISQSMETYGLTLPGMDDGILTTREDIIIANDGHVSVKAMPNYPYQYIMTVNSAQSKRVEQLYDHQSLLLSEEPHTTYAESLPRSLASKAGLLEDGWVYEGTDYSEGTAISRLSIKGPQGVDSEDGTDYTALYQAGLMPDTWVLHYDESSQQPVKLVSVGTYVGSKIFQESTFEEVEDLDSDMTLQGAIEAMYDTYRVDDQRRLDEANGNAPLAMPGYISGDFLPERSRAFFDNHKPMDWMSGRRSLRNDGMSRGIDYFTIEKNTAADIYFHALSNRQLDFAKDFQYPKGCLTWDSTNATKKYCLYAQVNASADTTDLHAGMTFRDDEHKNATAYLRLLASLKNDDEATVANMDVEAGGCALIFEYSGKASVEITMCLSGGGNGTALRQKDNRTFSADVPINVQFKVKLPKIVFVQPKTTWNISSTVNCTAKPHNEISAYGKIKTGNTFFKVATANIDLDIDARSVDNIANKWQFVSKVHLEAKLKGVFDWDKTFELWHAGPVEF